MYVTFFPWSFCAKIVALRSFLDTFLSKPSTSKMFLSNCTCMVPACVFYHSLNVKVISPMQISIVTRAFVVHTPARHILTYSKGITSESRYVVAALDWRAMFSPSSPSPPFFYMYVHDDTCYEHLSSVIIHVSELRFRKSFIFFFTVI